MNTHYVAVVHRIVEGKSARATVQLFAVSEGIRAASPCYEATRAEAPSLAWNSINARSCRALCACLNGFAGERGWTWGELGGLGFETLDRREYAVVLEVPGVVRTSEVH